MSTALSLVLVGLLAVLLVVGRIIGPYSRHIYRRTRMQGPAPMGSGPGGSGTAFGWLVSVFHIFGETNVKSSTTTCTTIQT